MNKLIGLGLGVALLTATNSANANLKFDSIEALDNYFSAKD